MAKSYHAILGVSPDASRKEVKQAYRRLAKQYHPDHEGGDSGKFRDIQEAYAALSHDCRQQADRRPETHRSHKVRVRVNPVRGNAAAEPLIPGRATPAGMRQRRDARFDRGRPDVEDLFEWMLRGLF